MPHPLSSFAAKLAPAGLIRSVVGIAQDFWADPPCTYPVIEIKLGKMALRIPNYLKPVMGEGTGAASMPRSAAPKKGAVTSAKPAVPRWRAAPGEIAEKMWGEGQALPAGNILLEAMIAPLGLSKATNVIDLSVGLGGSMRKLIPLVNQIRGYDTDAVFIERCKELSIKAGKSKQTQVEVLTPAEFTMPAIVDAVLARELFYRLPDKAKFLALAAAGVKINGHLAFTDYIVNPEHKAQPAIASWMAQEPGAAPVGLVEMAELLAKAGFEVRVSDDITAMYKTEVMKGLKNLALALGKAGKPDSETKKAILREMEVWIHRLGAMEQGMKIYRFHAMRG